MNGLEWIAAPIALAIQAIVLWLNARVVGFLPLDPPGGRKQHLRPAPLAGVVPAALMAGHLAAHGDFALAAAGVACAACGYQDDRLKERGGGLPWKPKALVLAGAATLVVLAPPTRPLATGWLLVGLVALVFVVTNALNFLDNTDGVALAVGGGGLLLATGASGPLATVAFAFLGTLPLNWPRARMFLGDAGALFLGLCLGAAAVRSATTSTDGVDATRLLAPIAVPLADFSQVVVARLILGVPPWVGDRRHLTHVASINLGVPRVAVAPLFGGLTVLVHLALTR